MEFQEVQQVYDLLQEEGKTLESKVSFSHKEKTKGKSIQLSLGRAWFNILLPNDYPLINESVTKKKMNSIIQDLSNKYSTQETSETIQKLQEEAFKLASISPVSFHADSFILSDDLKKEKEEFEKESKTLTPLEFKKRTDQLSKKLLKELDDKDSRISILMEAEIKGNPIDDWKSLLIAKGPVIDVEGKVLGPISKGIAEGFDKEDYYLSSSEARRNFYYKTISTATPGYTARRIVMANAGLEIDSSKKDCGTIKYFDIQVTEKNFKILVGRYYKSGQKLKTITEEDTDLIGKRIKMRSPLYCVSKKGICEICYGELANKLGNRNVGVLAGGAINQIGVNALMKLKHKSSQVEVEEVDFPKILKKLNVNIAELSKVLEITKNECRAKVPVRIVLDTNDYTDESLIETEADFVLPGIFDISYGESPNYDSITTPFNFKVRLNKPNKYDRDGKIIKLDYEVGELIFSQKSLTKEYNPGAIDNLIEGRAKYITNPEVLVGVLHEELSDIDLVHLELIVSNMFRDSKDPAIPCRLTGYKNCEIYGQKKLPYLSWLTGLAFENINKAIKNGLMTGSDAQMNSVEKVLLENFKTDIGA